MTYTLLELVQRVLSSIKGEEVNSYSDTAESLTVRDIVKECYFNIISNQDFPELYTFLELNASGDSTKPVLMTIPEEVIALSWVRYNGEFVQYMKPSDFYAMQNKLNASDANVSTMTLTTGTDDTIPFKFRTDGDPKYYTSYEDQYLVFDSYDSDAESTLQKTNTVCYGLRTDTWEDDDSFTPKLDSQQFNILLKDSKAMAFLELRQTTNQSEMMAGRKARISAEKKKWRANYGNEGYYQSLPNYGRK